MTRVLITGGSGMLGCELAPRLLDNGYTVRVMSRRAPNPGEDADVEWVQASLESGAGLAEAVEGANVIIHAASSPFKRRVDVDGTKLLLDHAHKAGIDHFFYISIVGIDCIAYSYYRNKLAAEELIVRSGVPWSILRATQFHYLIDTLIRALTRLPVALIPTDFQFQTISTSEVADYMVTALRSGASGHGRMPDIGGPEVLRLGEMARRWKRVQGMRRPSLHLPMPGKAAFGFRQGFNTTPGNRVGRVTWDEWLDGRYGKSTQGDWAGQGDRSRGRRIPV